MMSFTHEGEESRAMNRAERNGTLRRWLGDPLPARVVILRALQLGDLLCAVPAFRAHRAALPDAEIVLVGLPWAKVLVERFPDYLDGFREFPGYPGLPERPAQVERIPAFLTAMQAEQFDLALQMHGSGPFVNPLTVLFGARRCAGFYLPGDYCPDPDRFLPYPDQGLEIRRLLRLVEFLGIPSQGEELDFPLQEADFRESWKLSQALATSRRGNTPAFIRGRVSPSGAGRRSTLPRSPGPLPGGVCRLC
jgi:ADP-heptose:LPS heptosyltransferase